MNGFTGKILFVNLTNRTWHEEVIPDEIYERHLSGIGLAVYISTRDIPTGADPLGPENLLGFVSGILTGTGAFFSGRWMVTGKSPLTGGWGDANCGGNFGPAIKQCGYDGIFVFGIASEPVTLYVDEKKVEIRSATHLWGQDTTETEATLINESGNPRRARVACIGPAGEKLSLISGISNDRGRLAARSGLGAVMGSKKLKAVLLAGSLLIGNADSAAVKELTRQCNKFVPKKDLSVPAWIIALAGRFMSANKRASRMDGIMSLPTLRRWGTTAGNEVCANNGDAPIRNWIGSRQDYRARAISPALIEKQWRRKYHCYACPLGCGSICENPNDRTEMHRPEYETITGFGPLLLNTDLDSIFAINEFLNRAGMDSISAGSVVAFAFECFEKGLLGLDDTDGLDLHWGNSAAILELVKLMVTREGIGNLLADGVRVAAAKIGKGAEGYAMHVGGQELPMHDPKYDTGYGVQYLADPTPGRHTIGSGMTYEMLRLWTKVSWAPEVPKSYPVSSRYAVDQEKGIQSAGCSLAKMVMDGSGLCTFGLQLGVDRLPMFEYLNAVTGWKKTADEYMEIGHRIQTLRQLFNIQHEIQMAELRLPGRVLGQPILEKGPLKDRSLDVYLWRKFYYDALGWEADSGQPKAETMEKLGL